MKNKKMNKIKKNVNNILFNFIKISKQFLFYR